MVLRILSLLVGGGVWWGPFSSVRAYGTGSYPEPPHGWHLSSLLTASQRPFNGPCLTIACLAYSEHVGVKRHDGGVKGLMQRW